MALPNNAKVEATPNFLANLESIHQFFQTQDADTADSRFARLKADLREMIAVLAWSPAGGRPARFLMAKSAQARLKSETVLNLAEQAGLPYLREYVVGQHIVLYAHAETEAVLLAVKHQRQLNYAVADLAAGE
ncbi:type II toxin-antitoxin system RelE/ParE family toxin [Quatrionicoccus australiensis]|uniref:type II toxin-antitoxin system RelE/ParE family toxin n=1 Tax=Quatrionicoccus australiensis TaxID=138118 RepID=UPI001CFA6DC5|nr:type II toxin-antitoxin system RelE/ParE family toxin [Quatrionicoccus australiensis]MCB4358294.1 type II toxin-antitoxin system RelE/ParE family toxin [Quatrionicoccus australiensis]